MIGAPCEGNDGSIPPIGPTFIIRVIDYTVRKGGVGKIGIQLQHRQYQLRLLIRFFQIIRPLRSFSLFTEPALRGQRHTVTIDRFYNGIRLFSNFTTKRRCCQWNMARRQRKSDGNLCIRLDIRQKRNKYRKIIDFRNRCDPVPFSVFSV